MLCPVPRWLVTGSTAMLLAAIAWSIGATPSEAFQLRKSAVSGGAVTASGGSYALGATVAEAGVVGLTIGGSYRLSEGFWASGDILLDIPSDFIPLTPTVNAVSRALPSPFRRSTRLSYSVAGDEWVSMEVYDVRGRLVRTLVDDVRAPGVYAVIWGGRDDKGVDLGSGVYYLRTRIASLLETRKVLKIR